MKKGIKIVAVSDTHASTYEMDELIQDQVKGDIFIHAGDFTRYGQTAHFVNFFKRLGRLQFKHKIVVSGNHQIALDNFMPQERKQRVLEKYPCDLGREDILKEITSHAIYLQHELVEIDGLKIFGSPYTKKYSRGAFQYNKEDDDKVWSSLPQGIDILITHEPPFGILDQTHKQVHAGSPGLLEAVKKIKPKVHIFGHIHEGHGIQQHFGVKFMNVAKQYEVTHIE